MLLKVLIFQEVPFEIFKGSSLDTASKELVIISQRKWGNITFFSIVYKIFPSNKDLRRIYFI